MLQVARWLQVASCKLQVRGNRVCCLPLMWASLGTSLQVARCKLELALRSSGSFSGQALRASTVHMELAACNLQPPTSNVQPPKCNLQSANLQLSTFPPATPSSTPNRGPNR